MANESKRISQLGVATTLSANDRVVVLTNPGTDTANTQSITVNNFAKSVATSIPYANTSQAGVIKIGAGLSISSSGVVSAPLPVASKIVTGVVRIGDNINVDDNGIISAVTGISKAGGSQGYVLTSDENGDGSWKAFGGVYELITINGVGINSYTVNKNDSVIFVDPSLVGSDVTIILPISAAIEGKEILIKNLNPGNNNYKVIVRTEDAGNAYLESPITGQFIISYDLIELGQAETWIHDGTVYRHLTTARATPVFYTNGNTYAQVVVKNANGGLNASSDLVLYNNIGDEINGLGPFIDIGIESSTYSNSSYSLFGYNDAYVYTGSANLLIGTDSSKNIVFFTGGTNSSNEKFRISTTSIVSNSSIVPATRNYNLGNSSNYWNNIYANSIAVPNGSLITSTLLVSPVINNADLDHIVARSTSGASIPIGTYGNANEIPAPWSVYQLKAVPSPVLQVNDLVAGTGVPLNNYIAYIGTGAYANLIICNTTFTVAPENNTVLTVTRDVINPSFSLTTIANTNIALTPGSNGIIVVNSDIVPVTTNVNRLGTPAKRFRELWLGPGTIYVTDETLGVDQALGARDGNFYIKGGAGFNVGEFTFRDNQMAIANSARDILIGTALASGNVIFNRPISVKSYDTGNTTFSVTRSGRVQINTPSIPANDAGALAIIGSSDGVYKPVKNPGGMLHISGNDGATTRVTLDNFGTGTTVQLIGRSGRGAANSATPSQVNDVLFRIAGAGYLNDTNQFAALGSLVPTTMEFVAIDNFGDTTQGSATKFYNAPLGGNTKTLSMTVTSNGINLDTAGNRIRFSDGSVQNSAFNDTNAVTRINVGSGLSKTGSVGIVGLDSTGALSIAGATNQISVSNVGGNYTLTLPQSISTTSDVQFRDITIRNLNVTGVTTSAACTTIHDKTFTLAYDSTSASQIEGGGILLGNSSSSYKVSFVYNVGTNSWNTGETNLITKNITSNSISASNGSFTGQLHAGESYLGYDFPNATIQADCNTPSYNQTVIKNHSTSTQASADYVAVNNLGNDTQNYIDLGINSSNYANNDYSMGGPNDGYLYVNGGNLDIATQTVDKNIQFYTGNTTSDALRATINSTGLSVVGNVSASYFTGTLIGTANSANYIGSLPAANAVSNAQLIANLANYQLTSGMSSYQTTAGLSANVARLAANSALYVLANSGIVSNSSGVFVNTAFIDSIVAGDTSTLQTTAGLASNVATLTSNSANYIGSLPAANAVSNAQLIANLANYATVDSLSAYQTTSGLGVAVQSLKANSVFYVGTTTAANVVSNAQLVANLANYVTATSLTNNLYNYQTTGGLAANVATLTALSSNNTNYVGTVSAANVVSNAQLVANLANYQTTSGMTLYQSISTLSSAVAALTSNNTNYVGTVPAANVVSNAQLVANLANYVTTSTLTNYATISSLSSYQTIAGMAGSVGGLTSNSTNYVGAVSAANVVSNAQLVANLANYAPNSALVAYQTTAGLSANIASYLPTHTGVINSSSYTISTLFIANSTQVNTSVNVAIRSTAGIIANGSIGTANQVLASNGTSVYWTSAANRNIRDAGAVNSLVIDFASDEIILIQPSAATTFTMQNYGIGKKVEVWAAPSTTKNLTISNVPTSHITGGSSSYAFLSNQLNKITYLSTTTANTGVYVDIN